MKLLKRIKIIFLRNILIYLKQTTMVPNNEKLLISSMFGTNLRKAIIENEKINNSFQLNLLISSIIYSLAIMIFSLDIK